MGEKPLKHYKVTSPERAELIDINETNGTTGTNGTADLHQKVADVSSVPLVPSIKLKNIWAKQSLFLSFRR
jgi:hypothetical protein